MLALYLGVLETDEDKQLISEIYNMYWRKMMTAALGVLHEQELAEEAVHESFLKIIQNVDKFRAVAQERWAAWLVVVAANTARDMLKKESRYCLPLNENFWEQQPAENKSAERDFLLDEIECLPSKYREPLMLYYLFGYHVVEIAEIMDISSDNVKQRLSRARKMLRNRLDENF